MPAPKLTADALNASMARIPDWQIQGDKIRRTLEFADFNAAIAFINRLAPLADAADHHPELFNVYNRVVLELTTHDSQGLTHKDIDLAEQIDAVV